MKKLAKFAATAAATFAVAVLTGNVLAAMLVASAGMYWTHN